MATWKKAADYQIIGEREDKGGDLLKPVIHGKTGVYEEQGG
jgi:hypothetical protein